MVTRYNFISSRPWSHFWRKMWDFSPFWAKKYKMCTESGKMFNYVTFLMFSKKNISTFSFSCQILNFGEIQDGGQDGGHTWWSNRPLAALHPIIYTSSCRAHHKEGGGGVHQPSPQPPYKKNGLTKNSTRRTIFDKLQLHFAEYTNIGFHFYLCAFFISKILTRKLPSK